MGVEDHYERGHSLHHIVESLRHGGVDPDAPSVTDLAPFDQLHVGGLAAAQYLAGVLPVGPGDLVLDVGSGLGGPARILAQARDCRVLGIDLTEAFVDIATELTQRTGLDERVEFLHRNATDTGLDDASFDAAWQVHVGMNIPDKAAVFREVRRVLRPGATFLVYDVMRLPDMPAPEFPLPWATDPAHSHLRTPEAYTADLEAAGFRVEGVEHRWRPGTPLPVASANRPVHFANLEAALADGRVTAALLRVVADG